MGKRPINAKFSEEQESTIVQAYTDGERMRSLANSHSCSKSTIHRIIDGFGVVQNSSNDLPECRFPGIYKFTNRDNGKIYIGQSRNIHLRYKEHRKCTKGTGMSIAIKKYGFGSFNFEVIERVDDLSLLTEREQHWLDFYQSYKRSKGYNRARVVTKTALGCKHSAETSRKLSIRMRAYYAANPNFNLGSKRSNETRKKISEAKKQHSRFIELMESLHAAQVAGATKKVAQIDPKTSQIIRVWKSVTAIQQELGIPACTIRCACRGFQNNITGRYPKTEHAGYKWEYTKIEVGVYVEEHIIVLKSRDKPVRQIDIITGETLKVWSSVREINKELCLPTEAIKCRCRGYYVNQNGRHPSTTYGGFKWEYASQTAL